MKWCSNVLIVCSEALWGYITVGESWKTMYLDRSSLWKIGEASLFNRMYGRLIPLLSRYSWKSLNTWMKFCLYAPSWAWPVFYYYQNIIVQKDSCFSYWSWWGIFLLGPYKLASWHQWYWLITRLWVELEVPWGVILVSEDLVDLWTWGYLSFGACCPWLLPLVGDMFSI